MKNFILFFYNINAVDIKKRLNGDYWFNFNGEKYILKNITNYNYDLENIYNMHIYLLNNNVSCNKIILSKDNKIAVYHKDYIYVLIKPSLNYKKRIKLNDIINYDLNIGKINDVNWRDLWIKKIDYYEYQISQNLKKSDLVNESFYYFFGLTENAIQLLLNTSKVQFYISHRRINYKSTLYDLYDPFNIIFDTRVRDIADYFKSEFINCGKTNIIEYLSINSLDVNEKKLFFIRMLYPSYYFDLYDSILLNKNYDKIKDIISMISKYELFINELGNYLNRYNHIVDIPDWINQH